ncbi:MAG: hypothetical protein CMH28_07415 [Micavibrio sp.]|nr:hypothetical protein [Micavibrio sp.]
MHKAKPRKGGDTGKSAEGERSEGLDNRAEAASLNTNDHSYQEWPCHDRVRDRYPMGRNSGIRGSVNLAALSGLGRLGLVSE